MGCQSEVKLGGTLVFSINTHDPSTAALTDADSLPTYRVYENETATPILTGTMSKLDDPGTTGFYSEQVACSAGNGFENDKSYTVYIEATVGGVTGGISYGFLVHSLAADVWTNAVRTLTQSAAAVTAAVSGGTVTQVRATSWSFSLTGIGDVSDRTKLYFTVKTKRVDADSAAMVQIEETANLKYINGGTPIAAGNGTLTVNDAVAGNVTITLTHDESAKLNEANNLYYDIKKLTASGSQIMTSGWFNVLDLVTETIT